MSHTKSAPVLSIAFLILVPVAGAQELSTKIAPVRPVTGGLFGGAIDVEGDRLIVGAPEAGLASLSVGNVFLYERREGAWRRAAYLTAPDPAPFDEFGIAVAISGDRAVVGEPGDDEMGPGAGSVHVYERTESGWTHTAKLHAANGLPGERIGDSVSISGERILIGAQHAADAGEDSGAAYLFELAGSEWVQVARLTIADAEPFDRFGVSVDIDGTVAIVGSDGDDDVAPSAGAAFVFERAGLGWTLRDKLSAPDGGPIHAFGSTVSVSQGTAIVGSPVGGSAYAYERGPGGWSLAQVLTSSATADLFGASVDVSGNNLIVGAAAGSDPSGVRGEAHVFERTAAGWAAKTILSADSVPYGSAGSQVALSLGTYVLGNPFEATTSMLGGATYVFDEDLTLQLQR